MFLSAVFEAVPDNAYAVFDHTGRICILATLSADLEIFYYTEYDERKVGSALSAAAGRKKAKYEILNKCATKTDNQLSICFSSDFSTFIPIWRFLPCIYPKEKSDSAF